MLGQVQLSQSRIRLIHKLCLLLTLEAASRDIREFPNTRSAVVTKHGDADVALNDFDLEVTVKHIMASHLTEHYLEVKQKSWAHPSHGEE